MFFKKKSCCHGFSPTGNFSVKLRPHLAVKTFLIFLCLFKSAGCVYSQWQSEYPVIPLTDGEWNDSKPTFTADGQKIIFVSNRDNNQGIFSICLENNQVEALSSDSLSFSDFTIHKENQQILAVSSDGLAYWIGSNGKTFPAKAINNRAYRIASPSLNTTGNLLCFIGKNENSLYPTLFTYDRKYDNLNTHFGNQKGVNHPDWSPKSDYIIYNIDNEYYKTSYLEIKRWDASYITTIQSDTVQLKDANWGASSTKFICIGHTAFYYYLFILHVDGTLKEVVFKSERPLSQPDWSDDGTKIVVVMEEKELHKKLLIIDLQSL